jgi:hypothetical protein
MIFHQDSPITSRHLSCQLGTTRKTGTAMPRDWRPPLLASCIYAPITSRSVVYDANSLNPAIRSSP